MGKTVYFRAFEEEDADLIYQWMNDDELKKMSVGVNRRLCRAEALEWVRNRMRDSRDHIYWAICAIDTGKMIGYAQLTDIHYVNSVANFSGIIIGDKNYQTGIPWIETYLFIMDYVFKRLGLNRLYGASIVGHKDSNGIGKYLFWKKEGVMRQAVYKNGQFYDLLIGSILKNEYLTYEKEGLYDIKVILRRLRKK